MNILITGANGQLGSELRGVLEEKMPGITTYIDYQDLDLTDRAEVERWFAGREFTHIVNCAAYTAVDRAEEESGKCAAVNTDAVENLARIAADRDIKMIHISTDYVFDGHAYRPYTESDKVNPTSQHGSPKRKGETALRAPVPDSIVIRTAWLYSPFGNNFVKTMLRIGRERGAIKVVADQIGTPTYALDLANAIVSILSDHRWVGGIYHFTDEGVASWYDFAVAIHRIAGSENVKISPIPSADYPTPATRPFYSVLDKSRIKATYGIKIPHWETSLRHCLQRLNELPQ